MYDYGIHIGAYVQCALRGFCCVYVIDNYDLSLLYLHVEFFLACMCMALLPCFFMYGLLYACSVLEWSSCLLWQQRELCYCHLFELLLR